MPVFCGQLLSEIILVLSFNTCTVGQGGFIGFYKLNHFCAQRQTNNNNPTCLREKQKK